MDEELHVLVKHENGDINVRVSVGDIVVLPWEGEPDELYPESFMYVATRNGHSLTAEFALGQGFTFSEDGSPISDVKVASAEAIILATAMRPLLLDLQLRDVFMGKIDTSSQTIEQASTGNAYHVYTRAWDSACAEPEEGFATHQHCYDSTYYNAPQGAQSDGGWDCFWGTYGSCPSWETKRIYHDGTGNYDSGFFAGPNGGHHSSSYHSVW